MLSEITTATATTVKTMPRKMEFVFTTLNKQ
jgi:hypothetical protein